MGTVALNCFVFEKIAFFFAFWRQTDKRTDALSRSRYREWRLKPLNSDSDKQFTVSQSNCRVLSLSDRRYSLNPLNQTRID